MAINPYLKGILKKTPKGEDPKPVVHIHLLVKQKWMAHECTKHLKKVMEVKADGAQR